MNETNIGVHISLLPSWPGAFCSCHSPSSKQTTDASSSSELYSSLLRMCNGSLLLLLLLCDAKPCWQTRLSCFPIKDGMSRVNFSPLAWCIQKSGENSMLLLLLLLYEEDITDGDSTTLFLVGQASSWCWWWSCSGDESHVKVAKFRMSERSMNDRGKRLEMTVDTGRNNIL